MHLYFCLDLKKKKNRVGSPQNQKIKKKQTGLMVNWLDMTYNGFFML